jgi:hypothetical protein
MNIQAWCSVIVFVIAIIYSIVMASISTSFRETWQLQNVKNFMLFFMMIIVTFVYIVMSSYCSARNVMNVSGDICSWFAWLLVGVSFAILALFISQGIIAVINAKKNKKELSSLNNK